MIEIIMMMELLKIDNATMVTVLLLLALLLEDYEKGRLAALVTCNGKKECVFMPYKAVISGHI